MIDAAGPLPVDRSRFPALDPEPPPRPWYWRVARWAALLVVVGAVAVGVTAAVDAVGQGKGPTATVSAAPGPTAGLGRIVLLEGGGSLAVSDVDGTHLVTLSSLGRYSNGFAAATIDDRDLVASNGAVVAVHGARLAKERTRAVLTASQTTTAPDPLADHDQDLVVVQQSGSGPVWVVFAGQWEVRRTWHRRRRRG